MSNFVTSVPSLTQQIAPDIAAQQMALQRQQQMADIIRQQGMAPIGDTKVISGRAVPQSPLLGIANILQSVLGTKMQSDNDAKGLELGKALQGRMGDAFDQMSGNAPAAGSSSPDYHPTDASGNAPPSTYQAGGSVIGSDPESQQSIPVSQPSTQQAQSDPAANLRKMAKMAYMLGNQELSNKYLENANLMTDAQKNDRYQGITGAEQGNWTRQEKALSLIPKPIRLGEGAYGDGKGNVIGLPTAAPSGFINVQNPNGQWSTNKVNGGLEAVADSAAAALKGKNLETLASPDQSVTLPDGRTMPTSIDATLHPAIQSGKDGLDLSKLSQEQRLALINKDPAAFANGVSHFQNAGTGQTPVQGVGAEFGQKQGAENAQTELSKKWSALNEQNSQAQTTNSYLQNIKQLSDKAIVGPQADKLNYVNGLLTMVGNEKATDATTANNLLDKYSNQIVARLGSGGMGTDSARSILQSAYPNSHMTREAISEATANLVGANEMVKSKAALLSAHANNRDPANYNSNELAFDRAADPRIWQWKNMTDPVAKQKFAAEIMKVDPSFPNRIDALEKLGAFK